MRDVGRQVDLDDLFGAADIARELRLGRASVVYDWRRRDNDFPAPVKRLGTFNLWLWPEVEAWARATGRRE